ncbi:hypothetical protein H0H93_007332 [Arthromyces matolae]|nr:hypothetical protein H0H93_007332 [Arthromyces matolae]
MASPPFTVIQGRIVGFYVESIILGIYLVTLFNTIRSLTYTGTRWKRSPEINRPLLIVALLMAVNVTLGSALSFCIVWRAFVLEPQHVDYILGDLTNWAFVLKSATLLAQTVIGDAILASHTTHALISADKLLPFGIAFWALTVAINIITTTLLVLPIRKAALRHDQLAYHSDNPETPANTMKDVMHVIIESGFMYTVAAFLTFVTYATKHNSLYITSDAEVGIAGIAFNLIIIRTDKVKRAKAQPSIGATLRLRARPDPVQSSMSFALTRTRADTIDVPDTKTMRLPRATNVERIFRPLVKEIQENHNSDIPRELFPLSCDLVVLDLSLNFTMFVTGKMERYPGMSEKETKLVTFFEALTRGELHEAEVMQMARRLIGSLLETAIREYLKKKQRFKRSREGGVSDVPPLSKRPRNTCTTVATQEVHATYPTNVHLPIYIDQATLLFQLLETLWTPQVQALLNSAQ